MENEIEIYNPDEIPAEILHLVKTEQAVKFGIVPQGYDDENNLVLMTNNRQTLKGQKKLSQVLQMPCVIYYDDGDKVRSGLEKYYGYDGTRQGNIFAGIQERNVDSSPLAMEVERSIRDAMEMGASDIHYLPFSGGIYVQFRINGHLIDYTEQIQFQVTQKMWKIPK